MPVRSRPGRLPASFVAGDLRAEEGDGDDARVQTAEEAGRVVEPLGHHEGGTFARGGDLDESVCDGSGPGIEGTPPEGPVHSGGGAVGEVDMAEGALLRPVSGPVPQVVRE